MKEPIIELCILRDAMRAAVVNDRCAQDTVFAKFLWSDLGPGLAKRLSKERSNDEKVRYLSCLITRFDIVLGSCRRYS